MPQTPAIEVVRGRTDAVAEELVAFWAGAGGPTQANARARLPEVACVLRDDDGRVAGACSVFPAAVPVVGGRRFWVFRSLLPGVEDRLPEMVRATFAALEAEFDGAPDAPIGLCVPLDRGGWGRWPQAEWADPRMIHAGYLADGRQARIAYFRGASISGGPAGSRISAMDPDSRYRVVLFAEQDAISEQDVIDLWTSEGVLAPEEARRRIGEVLLVGADEHGRPVGVSSAYLQRNEQLGMDLWHYRAFVAAAHRMSDVAVTLAMTGRDHLRERFVRGDDLRAGGIVYEVENDGLKRLFHQARWQPTEFLFIGENERGAHVRVFYFPGALAPAPAQGST
ncbi:MAG: hypothetical protein JWM73_2861 [Solirubrobacterales bacterium]|nr:hypothetical protein [Solirubrobacterales bacterium]